MNDEENLLIYILIIQAIEVQLDQLSSVIHKKEVSDKLSSLTATGETFYVRFFTSKSENSIPIVQLLKKTETGLLSINDELLEDNKVREKKPPVLKSVKQIFEESRRLM